MLRFPQIPKAFDATTWPGRIRRCSSTDRRWPAQARPFTLTRTSLRGRQEQIVSGRRPTSSSVWAAPPREFSRSQNFSGHIDLRAERLRIAPWHLSSFSSSGPCAATFLLFDFWARRIPIRKAWPPYASWPAREPRRSLIFGIRVPHPCRRSREGVYCNTTSTHCLLPVRMTVLVLCEDKSIEIS